MNQQEALTVLVRRHKKEFTTDVERIRASGSSQKKAKNEVVRLIANKYQDEYVSLRGADLKGRL